MANTITRRPLPALVSLLALLALTGIVWWRVLNRDTGDSGAAKATKTPTPCATSSAPPLRTLPAPSGVTVTVLNSTSRVGIAGKARSALLADGFKVPVQAKNDTTTTITATAQIRYGVNGVTGAEVLHYYFPGAMLKKVHGASHTVTVSLGQKYKAVASPSTVRAALVRDRVALAPTTGSTAAPKSGSTPTTGASPSPAC